MEHAASVERATGDPPNPVDQTGLCLLSLDGGGVRGLSTLHVLKSLMTRLNHERQKSGNPALKPCELFDLIGGTSTGGLIAIMLGRLEMDVDECISAYNRLMEVVFKDKTHILPLKWTGRVQSRFDSAKLRDAIDDVITKQGYSPAEPFNDGKARGCRVFVCAAAKDLYGVTRLRSYDLPQKPSVSATLSEATLATSAATGFFDPVSIGARQFVDGALGANNPVEEVEGEASDIWCPDTGNVMPLVKCFISIGTGNPGKKAVEDNLLKFLSKTLVQITTETEETAKRFIARWRQHFDQNRYFRLNVDHGLQDVRLAEYKEQGRIEAATHQYLDDQQQIFRVRNCVANLKQKQRKAENSLADEIETYMVLRIRKQSGRTDLPCYNIPLPPNKRFLGREEKVEELRQKLFTPDGGQNVSLVGLGGVGKTQVAFQIAYWTKQNKPDYSVFWVSAISDATFEQSYAEISKQLRIQKNAEDEELQKALKRSLESEESGKWLLIVDNADDMDILLGSSEQPGGIFQYLPQNEHGQILFTTRFREVAVNVGGEIVELTEMTFQEAKSLLEKSLVQKNLISNEEEIAELLQELTYLPLAITQAAAYLNRNRLMIAEYVDLLRGTEQDVVGLMSREFHDSTRPTGTRHAVATTWLISFNQIRKADPAAADLLAFISCIEPKAVPQTILPRGPSEEALKFSIGTLIAYAFVVRRGETDTFDMHRLVHLAARMWIQRDGIAATVEESALRRLSSVFPSSNYSQRDRWRAYMPHALCLLQRDDTADLEVRYELCMKVGLCLCEDGRIKEAVRYLQKCYDWRREHFDKDHPSRLTSQRFLGMVYEYNGQVREAVQLLEEVVRIQRQTLAEDHPHRLASQHALALAYRANGQIKPAINLLEEVVRIRGETVAEDHPYRLASQHVLAGAYKENGQVKEAVQLLQEVVRIREQTLAEDHPHRLASQHELARAYQANGQVKEAIQLLQKVVRIQEQTLAEDHPHRLASQHGLARVYRSNGQIKDAVQLLQEVVQIQEQTLAEDHPHRLASKHNLASYLWELGEHSTALDMMRHVVEIHRRVLNPDHPDRIASEEWLEDMTEDMAQLAVHMI